VDRRHRTPCRRRDPGSAGGVLPSTFHHERGALVVDPWVIDLTPGITAVIFAVTFLSQVLTTIIVILNNRFSQERAQNRQHAQAWHLRQLLPSSGELGPDSR
jgi:hypothetical protein